ncbi:hypothetical protein QL285_025613 [Trifolium repens]|nr:hypothetical protein QL285_025613 [Trifolium repens]
MPSALMKILHPPAIGFLVAPTRFTAPSSASELLKSVPPEETLASNYPWIFRIALQASTTFDPRNAFRTLEEIACPQLSLGILGKFHKPQLQTLLVSNYIQQSYKILNLITVASNCFPEDL